MGTGVKLLERTSRYYLAFSLLAFLVAGLLLFTVLRYVIDDEMDDQVADASVRLNAYLEQFDTVPASFYQLDAVITTRPVARVTLPFTFSDTVFFEPLEGELEPYRKVTYDREINGRPYRISVSRLKVESADLLLVLFLTSMALLGLLLLGIFLLNRYLSRRLWQPFFGALTQVQGFDVKGKREPVFPTSSIEEFELLNTSLRTLTAKLRKDYHALRQFTDNASHELQTPLAIMRNQVDLMLQRGERSEEDFAHLQHLSEALDRLKKLNQALLLLSRIENEQYRQTERIALAPLIENKLEQLSGMIEARNLSLQQELMPTWVCTHPTLMDVLLNNLLSNAIKHNRPGGSITVRLRKDRLVVTNTGRPLLGDAERLFGRFVKEDTTNQSLGLGLPIVAEICKLYGYRIDYRAPEAGLHRVTVVFIPCPGDLTH